ncbi:MULTISPECIES: serine/threonine protein kinase [Crateriforma]|uniref:Serine/threonine-protein kinase PknD n=1 Tax=Crateriforma conspicua TaxID=2527996 RepID=A0A5C6FLU1_9PLAN|nr:MULTISPECIES: serine/threonine-protein kinase [Crateriforma]TWU61002.1 Serine/threonine-protein kinase PknD [Crateriforma conspicua]
MTVEPSIILSGTDPDLPTKLPSGLQRYTGLKEMARGGSAILRSGFDRIVGRTVAIKTLLPETKNNRKERRRFLREARVTAQLQHPNTVPVYEIGNDLMYGIFFVMKRISGENFFEILKRIARKDEATIKAFPLRRRLEVVADTCQALAYAHARGVIHRDVKPENIWVGNFGEVILLDWGTAKVWGHADDNEPIRQSTLAQKPDQADQQLTTLTGGGQRPGTPLYMSPEQVSGNRGIDERSDIFSVGVVLYEMLALREPFRGRNIDETFNNIRSKDVPPPSETAPDRQIPALADQVVMKAIQKRPGDRYQSMRDLIAAIGEIRDQEIHEPQDP